MDPAIQAQVNAALQAALGPAVEAEIQARIAAGTLPVATAAPAPAPTGITAALKLGSPPDYSGNLHGHSPKAWLFKINAYFAAAGIFTTDLAKISFATYYLSGAALAWWRNLEGLPDTDPRKPATWATFQSALIASFEEANPVETARDRLASLQQRTSVRQYSMLLRNTALEIPGITSEELKDRFIRGLKKEVRQEVRMKAPATFEEAVVLAERWDSLRYSSYKQAATSSSFLGKNQSHSHSHSHNGTAPMDLGAVTTAPRNSNPRNQPSGSKQPLGGKLTPELRQQLIKEGRCFYCRETGHVALECPKRKKKHQ